MAEPSTPASGGTPPAKDEVELLEILELLVSTKKARTTADLLKYATQYGAPQVEERLRKLEAENIPMDLAFDAISVEVRINAHKKNTRCSPVAAGRRPGSSSRSRPMCRSSSCLWRRWNFSCRRKERSMARSTSLPTTQSAEHGPAGRKRRKCRCWFSKLSGKPASCLSTWRWPTCWSQKCCRPGFDSSRTCVRTAIRAMSPSNSPLRFRSYMKSARFPIFLFLPLVLLLFGSSDALAASAATTTELPLDPNSWQASWSAGALMLLLLFAAFFAMTRYEVPLPLAMSLVSCAFLVIQWESATAILRSGFGHYADITILFTAVAIPAHMIERSQGFKWVAAWLVPSAWQVRLRYAPDHAVARRFLL